MKKLIKEIPDNYVYIGTVPEFTTNKQGFDDIFWTLKIGCASSVERVYCRYEENCIKGICHFAGVTESEVLAYVKSVYQPVILGRRRAGHTEMFGKFESRQEAEAVALQILEHYKEKVVFYIERSICSKIPSNLTTKPQIPYKQEFIAELARVTDWSLSKEEIYSAVVRESSLAEASSVLGIPLNELRRYLTRSEIRYMFGERWKDAVLRQLNKQYDAEDTFVYPSSWNSEFLSTLVEVLESKKTSLDSIASSLLQEQRDYFTNHQQIFHTLGRFLQVNGYDPYRGYKRQKPRWIKTTGRIY